MANVPNSHPGLLLRTPEYAIENESCAYMQYALYAGITALPALMQKMLYSLTLSLVSKETRNKYKTGLCVLRLL